MKKAVIIILLAFSVNCFSQPKEFKLTDTKFNVEDSCLIDICYDFNHWGLGSPHNDSIFKSVRLFLKKNSSTCILIASYTGLRGKTEYNDTLSYYRSKAIKEQILLDSTIDSNRITTKGFGARVLMHVTKAMHKKYKFLPVGQLLDRTFINSLATRDEQEIAHSFNIREVVKITKK